MLVTKRNIIHCVISIRETTKLISAHLGGSDEKIQGTVAKYSKKSDVNL